MLLPTLLLLALAAQQPTATPQAPKARVTQAQRADTSKAKAHRTRRRARKAQHAAPRDTTKAKP